MFGYLRRGYVIEKAYDFWRREAGIDLKSEVAKYPWDRQTAFRNMLRESQKDMEATESEVAVMMMMAFLPYLDSHSLGVVSKTVDRLTQGAFIRATIYRQFRALTPHH